MSAGSSVLRTQSDCSGNSGRILSDSVWALFTAGQYAKGLSHLVIMVLLIRRARAPISRGMCITMLGITTGFFYVYQIIDAVRTAKAIQMGEPAPDPFGLAAMFGRWTRSLREPKIPAGAAILIGLGVLFLLHTAGLFEFGLDRFWPLILIFLGVWLFAKQWGLLGDQQADCVSANIAALVSVMGPAMLVTLGVLFLLDSVSHVGFGRTWPAILLVIGVVKLMQSNASFNGHVGPLPPGSSAFPPAGAPPPQPRHRRKMDATEQSSSGEVKNV